MSKIKEAFFAIHSRCDGAHAKDGAGFNAPDAGRAKRLSSRADVWRDCDDFEAHAMLRKYAAQLAEQGIVYAELPVPAKFSAPASDLVVTRTPNQAELQFSLKWGCPRFETIKDAVKGVGARWDGSNKTWRVGFANGKHTAILSLIDDYDFELSAGAIELLNDEPAATPAPQVTASATVSQLVAVGNPLPDVSAIFTKLKTGDWGIKASVATIKSGDVLTVTKKDGGTSVATVKIVVWRGATEATATIFERGEVVTAEAVAKAAAQSVQIVEGLSPEQQARLDVISPRLLAYQVPAVANQVMALQRGGTLDASDCGVGKTFVALASAYVMNRPIFVICPKGVIPSWYEAAAKLKVPLAGACNYELATRGGQPFLSKDAENKFRWNLSAQTIIAFDECHKLRNYKTLNFKMGAATLNQGYSVFGLSATAAEDPQQMGFVGALTGLFMLGKHWGWMLNHGVSDTGYGFKFNGNKSILEGISRQIFPQRGTRLRIADLGDAFPETQIAAQAYELGGTAAKQIDAIYAEMHAELKRLRERAASDDRTDGPGAALVARLRARQQVELLKIPALVEAAEDAVESGMSVAIFVNFNESADALCEKLKTKCVIRGGQSAEAREANRVAFQADKEPIIIANIKAGGVGVSLHGSPGSRMRFSLICPTDSGTELVQALGRVWRANGAKSIQRVFFAAGTIEEKVRANVAGKIERINAINDSELAEALTI